MARTKIKRRTYNLENPQQMENVTRETERILTEEPEEEAATKPFVPTETEEEDLPKAFMDSPTDKCQGDESGSKVEDGINTCTISPDPNGNGLDMSPTTQYNGLDLSPSAKGNGLDMSSTIKDDGFDMSSTTKHNRLVMSSTTQDNGLDMSSTTKDNGLAMSSTTKNNGLAMSSTTKDNGLDMSSTTIANGLGMSSTTKGNGLDMSSTTKGNGLAMSPISQDNGFDMSPISQDNGLDMSPISQESGLEMSPISQDYGLDISPTTRDNGIDMSLSAQDNILDLSPISQDNGFDMSPTSRDNGLDMSLKTQEDAFNIHLEPVSPSYSGDILSHDLPRSLADIETQISRDSPLNLAWDSSMKENCRLRANAPDFRPVTPDFTQIPLEVDYNMFPPSIQRKLRTAIWASFPDGPPGPPAVRPMRRPKKGDEAYIVGCTKRPRVPSPTSLTVFQGDQYGITSNTNCEDGEDQYSPEYSKRGRRAPNGSASLSKSRFNPQSHEIAEKLKLREKIDRLLGRTHREEPVSYMSKPRSFSPLPSTSTDNETIMKNDTRFSESLNCDSFDIDDDDELPEVLWGTRTRLDSPLATNEVFNESKKNYTDNILIEINDDMNNNNNNDEEICEIQFDKYMPKEKIIVYSDVEGAKSKELEEIDTNYPGPSRVVCPTTSTDVFCLDDAIASVNPVSQANTSVLRASNKIAPSTETKQSDLVIEVPDVIEPVNMTCQASTSRLPAWHDEVQFVSEVRPAERLPRDENVENIPDVQIIQGPSRSQSTLRVPADMSLQFLIDLSETYARRKSRGRARKRSKRQKANVNPATTVVNNENTAPSVNQQPASANSTSQPAAATPETAKRLGECPICLDSMPSGSIASTNCGHVFCLECIKQSLKTIGKRCPTCRKQLRGVGYHQVFL